MTRYCGWLLWRVVIIAGRYRQRYSQAFGECGKSDRQNDRQNY